MASEAGREVSKPLLNSPSTSLRHVHEATWPRRDSRDPRRSALLLTRRSYWSRRSSRRRHLKTEMPDRVAPQTSVGEASTEHDDNKCSNSGDTTPGSNNSSPQQQKTSKKETQRRVLSSKHSEDSVQESSQSSRPVSPSESEETSVSSIGEFCRICHCEGTLDLPLLQPCLCSGSMRHVHQSCLQQWIQSSNTKACELCRYQYNMTAETRPFKMWRKLEMSAVERRRVICSVSFHAIAITCVVWSLYVLIERTASEISNGNLHWPFWTKLVVVAIGFTGGIVFMYFQCKLYIHLFKRWKAYNKIVYIQDMDSPPVAPIEFNSKGSSKDKPRDIEAQPSSVLSGTEHALTIL